MPVITAPYPGICPACAGKIRKGQRIAMYYAINEWVHVPCMRKAVAQDRELAAGATPRQTPDR